MNGCRPLKKENLDHAIKVDINKEYLDFQTARQEAIKKAHEVITSPILMAWYDKKAGRYSPPVECCGDEKPSWMIYAESRGGNTVIDVNDGEFVFMFADFEE
jgi:hypothetical protein